MPVEKYATDFDDEHLTAMLSDACPPVRLRTPLRYNVARRLREEIAQNAEPTIIDRLLSPRQLLPGFLKLAAVGAVVAVIIGAVFFLPSLVPSLFPLRAEPTETAAVLEIQLGTASVLSGGATTDLRQGERTLLRQGDVVETAPLSAAVIIFLPGQTTELGPGTRLQVESVATVGRKDTIVSARLLQGLTNNNVVKLESPRSRFQMHAPALTATVMGTRFRMVTISNTKTYVSTEAGGVRVESDGKAALVKPGQQIVANLGQALLVAQQPTGGVRHTVQSGDTLWAIASRNGLTVVDLMQTNPWIWDPDLILPGWDLLIRKE